MDPGETEIYIAILLASAIIGIVIIYFIITIIRNHKRYLKLQRQQLIAEITTLEYERKRIVCDLHDELGPRLAVVKFQVTNLSTTIKHDVDLIGKASSNIDDILHRVREICNHLMPDVLIRKGLFTAINDFIAELDTRASMDIIFNFQPVQISPPATLHIYRMIQEIVNNAIKHSGASRLQIDLNFHNKKLTLEASDNGKGFNAESATNENNGLGIKNIFGRTRMLNGDMYLISEPGKGTTYKIEIPICCNEPQDTIDNRR